MGYHKNYNEIVIYKHPILAEQKIYSSGCALHLLIQQNPPIHRFKEVMVILSLDLRTLYDKFAQGVALFVDLSPLEKFVYVMKNCNFTVSKYIKLAWQRRKGELYT